MPPTTARQEAAPYSVLAAGYDLVMEHVDYAEWAAYVLALLAEHAPETRSVLELGCGTGSLALEVQARAAGLTGAPGGFRYLATDVAEPMVRVARQKAAWAARTAGDLRFAAADFTRFDLDGLGAEGPFDAVLLLYDGLNYLLEEGEVAQLLDCAVGVLRAGGVFVLDQSTPANSLLNEALFEDEGEAVGDRPEERFAYVRRSRYDADRRLHTTEFDLTVGPRTFHERHVQRAYTKAEVEALIAASPFAVAAAYDGFTRDPATDRSERIHWLLQKPEAG